MVSHRTYLAQLLCRLFAPGRARSVLRTRAVPCNLQYKGLHVTRSLHWVRPHIVTDIDKCSSQSRNCTRSTNFGGRACRVFAERLCESVVFCRLACPETRVKAFDSAVYCDLRAASTCVVLKTLAQCHANNVLRQGYAPPDRYRIHWMHITSRFHLRSHRALRCSLISLLVPSGSLYRPLA
jgi:hypothetical protein